ncbi:MAG: hypothetical protein Q4C48_05005 [Lachnospiraceae bacterium]|nr:hypothetical protein [Lachnospiraceae bacterium]
MNRQIKAEWYRLVHSGHYFGFFLFVSILIAGIPFLINPDYSRQNLLENLAAYGELLPMLIGAVTCTFLAVLLCSRFGSRTAYYEIMDGARPAKIIWSKLLVYCPLALGLTLMQFGIFLLGIGLKNGGGEMKSPALFALLFLIVLLHLFSVTVMMSLLVQHPIGAAFPYARFMLLEELAALILLELNPEKAESFSKLLNWLPMFQLANLVQASYSTLFVVQVIAGFAVEFAVLYAITFAVYKKRLLR